MKYFVGCLGPLTDARQSSNNNDNNNNNNDLEVAHPQSGSPSTWFLVELEFGNVTLVFEERGKLEYPEKNLSEQRREPKTKSTHICRRGCLHCNSLSSWNRLNQHLNARTSRPQLNIVFLL